MSLFNGDSVYRINNFNGYSVYRINNFNGYSVYRINNFNGDSVYRINNFNGDIRSEFYFCHRWDGMGYNVAGIRSSSSKHSLCKKIPKIS